MNKLKCLSPIFSITIIWSIYHSGINAFRIYPVFMNLLFFTLFLVSSFREETFIQKIAKQMDVDFGPEMEEYTRKLTYVWVAVCGTNLLFSIITLFLSSELWALYNGCLCYILMGSVLVLEYPVRVLYRRKIKID